jgi:hypothetical protein
MRASLAARACTCISTAGDRFKPQKVVFPDKAERHGIQGHTLATDWLDPMLPGKGPLRLVIHKQLPTIYDLHFEECGVLIVLAALASLRLLSQ